MTQTLTASSSTRPGDPQPIAAGRRGSRLVNARTVGTLSVLLGLIGWEVYARVAGDPLFFPTLTSVVSSLVAMFGTSEYWVSFGRTLTPFVYGWILAIVFGVLAGLVVGRSVVVARLAAPYIAFMNALPISTLVPVVVVLLGIGIAAGTAVVFLFAFVEVLLCTAAGVRYISADVEQMARSFQMRPLRRFRKITIPGAMPGIMAGVRVGTGRAIVGMVVLELLLVSTGMGKLLSRYREAFLAPELYAIVLSLAAFGLILMALVQRLESRVLSWRPDQHTSS